MKRRRIVGRGLGLASAGVLACPAVLRAQGRYPDRTIRLVIPFAPGGATDVMGRHLAHRLSPLLGQQVMVENKASSGGVVGTAEVARARPDGYTLVLGTSSTHGISPSIVRNIGYDAVADFAPIMVVSTQPMLLATHPSFPAETLSQLIALTRANPGRYSYGSAGIGSINHLTGELLKMLAGGLDIVHVPYRGGGLGLNDLVAGTIELFYATAASALPLWRSGQIRIPAVFGERRMRTASAIPTAIEQGMPAGMVSGTFNVLCAPTGTSSQVIDLLYAATRRVMSDEGLYRALDELAIEPVTDSDPAKAADAIRVEIAKWLPVIRANGIQSD